MTWSLPASARRAGRPFRRRPAYDALEYQDKYTEYNPDLAMQLLDEVGVRADADGVRTRPDGSPLELIITIAGARRAAIPPTVELIVDHWSKVGIAAIIDDVGPRGTMWQKFGANESMISAWGIDGSDFAATQSQGRLVGHRPVLGAALAGVVPDQWRRGRGADPGGQGIHRHVARDPDHAG